MVIRLFFISLRSHASPALLSGAKVYREVIYSRPAKQKFAGEVRITDRQDILYRQAMENEKQMRANMDNKKDYELADKLGKDLYDELAGRKQLFKRFDL